MFDSTDRTVPLVLPITEHCPREIRRTIEAEFALRVISLSSLSKEVASIRVVIVFFSPYFLEMVAEIALFSCENNSTEV